MADIAILLNPNACNGKAGNRKTELENTLKKYEIDYQLLISESESHLRSLVSQTKDCHTIVGAGGDGTFNIIVNELMKHGYKTRFAMLPLGLQNDIAREFGVDSLEEACYAIMSLRRTTQIDLGVVTADKQDPVYFLGTASLGLGVTVNKYVSEFRKRHPRAGVNFFDGLLGCYNSFSTKSVPLKLTVSYGNTIIPSKFSLIVFNNTSFYAGGIKPSKGAKPDDGLLDCCLIESDKFSKYLLYIYPLAYFGQLRRARGVRLMQSNSLRIRAENTFEIQTDGEIIGPYRDINISVKPKALSVIVSSNYATN